MTWRDDAINKAHMFLENDFALALSLQKAGHDITASQAADMAIGKLVEIAETSFPLARVMDESDIVFHAEGPGASRNLPWLSALNWMANTVNSNLRSLSSAALDILGADGRKLAKNLDLRIPGIAHASLWMGVKLMPPEADMLEADTALFDTLRERLKHTGASGLKQATSVAHQVGKEVREVMIKSSGTAPENLKLEEDMHSVQKGIKNAHKEIKRIDAPSPVKKPKRP